MRLSLLLLLSSGCWVSEEDLTKQINLVEDRDQDGFKAIEWGGQDCDDTNAEINPNATEVCGDDLDNDCSGDADGPDALDALVFYADTDGDESGDADTSEKACEAPAGFVIDSTDCDDTNADINPEAQEVCNQADDNCDGTIDEDSAVDASTFYADSDSDGFGDADVSEISCEASSGYVVDNTDCDDNANTTFPGADETCNGADDNCDGTVDEDTAIDAPTFYADADSDGFGDALVSEVTCTASSGYVADNTDCDDTRSESSPTASEICDGLDNNCDGTVPSDEVDNDSDGFVECTIASSGWHGTGTPQGDDCNDALLSIYPGAAESCDTIDSDCDGTTDDGDEIDQSLWYEDADSDGHGGSVLQTACDAPSGFVASSDDCDDNQPLAYPGNTEVPYDGIDNDCTGGDECDVDGDNTLSDHALCGGTDCDDSNSAINTSAVEVCDGNIDNNCNGVADDQDTTVTGQGTWYPDNDHDGYGNLQAQGQLLCDAPPHTVANQGDCDDGEPLAFPGNTEVPYDGIDNDCQGGDECDVDADGFDSDQCSGGTDCDDTDFDVNTSEPETCNGVDDNCDGAIDENFGSVATYYQDSDGDGFGNHSVSTTSCLVPVNYVSDNTDCDDTDFDVNPDANEVLEDGIDSNCNADPDDLDWVEVSTGASTNLKGIRMTGYGDTLYLTWAADSIPLASGGVSQNALAIHTIDAFDPLSSSNETLIWSNSSLDPASWSLGSGFDVVADNNYLYWGHATYLMGFSPYITVQTLDLAGQQFQALNQWPNMTSSANSYPDLHLYAFEHAGFEHLQVTGCSGRDGTEVLFGNRSDFHTSTASGSVIQSTDFQEIGNSMSPPQPLPNAHECGSYHRVWGPGSTQFYPTVFTSNNTSEETSYFYLDTGMLYRDYFYPTQSLAASDAVFIQDHRALSIVEMGTNPYLYMSVSHHTWGGSYFAYKYGVAIEQLQTTASSNGETLTCAIDDTGAASLYYISAYENPVEIHGYSLSPPWASATWDECAITTSASGTLAVALLSGTTLYLGAIDLP